MVLAERENALHLPLHDEHKKLNARMGHFGPWEVPLYYTSILQEHVAVRNSAGIFDISHMGEFLFDGPGAQPFLQFLLCRDVEKLAFGKALYMPLLNEQGGIIDDIILYKFDTNKFLMIVNASNTRQDFEWISSRKEETSQNYLFNFKNISDEMGLLALQGPSSQKILESVLGRSFRHLKNFSFEAWESGIIARTGYTGEDGFELLVENGRLGELWKNLITSGKDLGLQAIGFGARDTLRLEAGMLLHGHDMMESLSPFQAGIGWAVDLKKENFIGREALLKRKETDPDRLIGFEMIDRGIPRQDCEIFDGKRAVGKVTSGSFSPTLKKNIGLGYVPVGLTETGRQIAIGIRGACMKAQIVNLPFYRRKRT